MRNILRDLKNAVREFLAPWPPPEDEDLVTPAAMRQWVNSHKHLLTCDGTDNCGCAS